MRLWTLHPKYLDRMGLVALWREGLLAQAVLRGNTKGYLNHPQLDRFKKHPDPLQAIAYYLHEVLVDAIARGYNFDPTKVSFTGNPQQIQTTGGQLEFEHKHLLRKLKQRSTGGYARLIDLKNLDPHPLFQIVPGDIEEWEKSR